MGFYTDLKISGALILIGILVVLAAFLYYNNQSTDNAINKSINQTINNTTTNNTDQLSLSDTLLTHNAEYVHNTPTPTPPGPGPDPNPLNKIIKVFGQYVKSTYNQTIIPAAAAVIVQDGRIVYLSCWGVKDINTQQPVDSNTLFMIGSVSKQFSATNIAQMVSLGLMAWDDPVRNYYPDPEEFQLYDSYVTDNITIRDLLLHRSGLSPYSGDSNWMYFNYPFSYDLHQLRYLENSTEFRSTWQYHNLLYALAEYCAARKAGLSWNQLMEEELLHPLGMYTATTTFTDFLNSPNHTTPYILLHNGTLKEFDLNLDAVGPAGSLACSIREMANWLKFQIKDTGEYKGQQILSKDDLDLTRTGQINTPFPDTSYGFGWFVDNSTIYHTGDTSAFHSAVLVYPSQRLAIAVFTNGGAYAAGYRTVLIMKFRDLVKGNYTSDPWPYFKKAIDEFWKPILPDPTPPIVPPLPFTTYTGTYYHDFYGNLSITSNNNLLYCYYGNNSQAFDLKHWNGDVFIDPTNNLPFNFTDIHNDTAYQLTVTFFNQPTNGIFTRKNNT